MQRGHAAGFGAAEFAEDRADVDVVDVVWGEVRELGEGGFEDLVMC